MSLNIERFAQSAALAAVPAVTFGALAAVLGLAGPETVACTMPNTPVIDCPAEALIHKPAVEVNNRLVGGLALTELILGTAAVYHISSREQRGRTRSTAS